MIFQKPKFILTDIEGTTTSISFVTDILFPYFRTHISELLQLKEQQIVQDAFDETVRIAKEEDLEELISDAQILSKLVNWSIEDRKITPLKTLQGVLWELGYQDGTLKGHVYPDVEPALQAWKKDEIPMGVFSSGSVEAQKLIFGYSISGDLTPYFSAYFDTKTGGKRASETYKKIATSLQINPKSILFLSDIEDELKAAELAGFQTIQLCRELVKGTWNKQVKSFEEIEF